MHKARIIGLTIIVVFAALAAYFWWPSGAPQGPDPAPHSVLEPAIRPFLPLPPSPRIEPIPSPEEFAAEDALKAQDEPEIVANEPITSLANLTLLFFDDLAQRVVDRYHPARTEHNADNKGVLLLSLSALNLRYGAELVGLKHGSSSVLEAREEIFEAMLRPEMIDAAWQAFGAYFLQALIDRSLSAKRVPVVPDGARAERILSAEEVSEFLWLLSAFSHQIAQAVHLYVRSDQAVPRTNAWLEARSEVLSANSHYQHVEALLEETLLESPADQDKILALRLERDTASQEILGSIKAREHAKQHLLALYKNDPLTKNMSETELLYVSQWLYRRLHQHPGRVDAFALLAQRLHQFVEDLQDAAKSVTVPAPV